MNAVLHIIGFIFIPFMTISWIISPWYEKLLITRRIALLVLVTPFVAPFFGLAYIGGKIWNLL
jgi:hypothetical protein